VFIVGIAFLVGGYAAVYYGVGVLSWSRSPNADKVQPAPLKYLLGLSPAAGTASVFHPPFTMNSTDRENAVIALGGAGANAAPAPAPGGILVPAPPGTAPTPDNPHPLPGLNLPGL
jgi:hypothetical protein